VSRKPMAATDGSQLTARSLLPPNSGPSAVSRKPMADADRGIEDYGTLQNLIGKPGLYRQLMERFQDADRRYNSGLFDFRKDTVTPSLKIDDKLLSDILSELYPPKSPYEFSVIGIEILGQVYEQFLGKVIKLTDGHRAKVEPKPEVRKAGGVYYTPIYISKQRTESAYSIDGGP